MKKFNALRIIVCLTAILSLMATAVIPQTAMTAEAATVKLNKTKLTLDTGKSYTLKLSGTSSTVKWSTNNKKVATVSSKGKVTAVAEGTATITATAKTKKYTCKVTVKHVLTAQEAVDKITSTVTQTAQGVVVVYNNPNDINLYAESSIIFYDGDGNMLSTDTEYIGTFEAGSKYVVTFYYPTDSDYNYVDFDNFDIEIEVNLNPLMMNKTYVKNISVESNVGADNIMAKFTNNSNATVESLSFVVLFYYNGEIVGYSRDYAYDLAAGDSTTIEFYEPYDADFNDIPYDDYEVIVNDAYSY